MGLAKTVMAVTLVSEEIAVWTLRQTQMDVHEATEILLTDETRKSINMELAWQQSLKELVRRYGRRCHKLH